MLLLLDDIRIIRFAVVILHPSFEEAGREIGNKVIKVLSNIFPEANIDFFITLFMGKPEITLWVNNGAQHPAYKIVWDTIQQIFAETSQEAKQ
jgi:hypothetical protein